LFFLLRRLIFIIKTHIYCKTEWEGRGRGYFQAWKTECLEVKKEKVKTLKLMNSVKT